MEVSHASRRSVDHPGARDFVKGFTSGIIDTRIGSATLAVLRCTMLCKSPLDSPTADRAVQVLLEDLADFGRKYKDPSRCMVPSDGLSICSRDCPGHIVCHPLTDRV